MPTREELEKLLEAYKNGQEIPAPDQQDYNKVVDAFSDYGPPKPLDFQELEEDKLPPITSSLIKRGTSPVHNTVTELSPPTQEREATSASSAIENELKNAIAQRNKLQFFNNLAKAGETAGSAIANRKADYGFYEDFEKQSGQPVSDVSAKQRVLSENIANQIKQAELATAKEKNDPKSQVSQLYRKVLGEMGVSIGDNATASSIEKAFPAVEKFFQARESAANRALMREQMNKSKEEAALERITKNFNEALDPTKGRSGQFGQLYQNYVQAEKLKALTTKAANGLNLNPAEMEEFSLGLARLISGSGGSSRAQVEALVPHTARGNVAKTIQWLTNNPTGTEQQEFVKRMLGTVEREQNIAKSEMQKIISKRAQAYERLKKKDPEAYQRGLESAVESIGISPEQYQDFLKNKTMPSQSLQKVKVSNGKETLLIDPSDLEHAKADGYTQVE